MGRIRAAFFVAVIIAIMVVMALRGCPRRTHGRQSSSHLRVYQFVAQHSPIPDHSAFSMPAICLSFDKRRDHVFTGLTGMRFHDN
ncbi:MAG: hypothetical protein P8013_04715 [Candidatus Sulfobium sp.]